MHPIEHLRFLARSNDPDPDWLVPEAADALAALAHDRVGLVLACRKLVERQPACGPLWWLCAQVLTAADPRKAAREASRVFHEDPTPLQVSMALTDSAVEGAGSIEAPMLLSCTAAAPEGALVAVPDPALARVGSARERGVEVWLVTGVGRVLPAAVWNRATEGIDRSSGDHVEPGRGEVELVPAERFDQVVGPNGFEPVEAALRRSDVTVVPELLRIG